MLSFNSVCLLINGVHLCGIRNCMKLPVGVSLANNFIENLIK